MWEKAISMLGTRGRANRATYWKVLGLFWLTMIAFTFAIRLAVPNNSDDPITYIFIGLVAVLMLCALWLLFAVSVRRLHDRDMSGWWLILNIVFGAIIKILSEITDHGIDGPLGIIAVSWFLTWIIELGYIHGTEGDNRFGSKPLAPKETVALAAVEN